jgi:hypothetical protein
MVQAVILTFKNQSHGSKQGIGRMLRGWSNFVVFWLMWVKQCHKPPMTGNGKFIPPKLFHAVSAYKIHHEIPLQKEHMAYSRFDPEPYGGSPTWILSRHHGCWKFLNWSWLGWWGKVPFRKPSIQCAEYMGYNQHLSAISGGCEALTAGSPAALKLGRPRPKMPSKGPGSTKVAMENQNIRMWAMYT